MLAMKVQQKDGTFYMTNYRAPEILRRVRFQSRHYDEGYEERMPRHDEEEIASFIRSVERKEGAFQRRPMARKIQQIMNFYEHSESQPMIPGPVLLYTSETLRFEPIGAYERMGNLLEPASPFIIIDGQHRLAGLKLYQEKHPDEAERVEVPTIIFDGHQEDFAAEMFVIINSTHTKINKSHLVDLMERVTYGTSPEKKWAAWIVSRLYEDERSPLRYKINKLGGRSRQEKWILQSELFNEVYRLVDPRKQEPAEGSLHRYFASEFKWDRRGSAPEIFIAYLKAAKSAFGDAWGDKNYMVTTSVTIKALVRALGDLLQDPEVRKALREEICHDAFSKRIAVWKEMIPEFRREGFYERFAAKGQVERVRRIHNELVRRLGRMRPQ
ncbi:MAG: DGQHR domain-containing protein [Candidatus Thermoplasmatota archaeon]